MDQSNRRPALWVLAASLTLGAAYRLYVSFTDDGIFWPDEIYQSLEPAHRLVFGYGMVPWEFIDGARNWALPGVIAGLMKVADVFGFGSPRGYLGLTRVVFVGVATATAWASYALARGQGAKPLAAAVGASCFALGSLPLYFGHRAMSETASALPVTLGLWLTLRNDATRRHLVVGASLLGVAVLLRLQCGVFAAGAVGVLLARRQWKPAGDVLLVLGGWALAFGLLDKLTWGAWFHSAAKYIEFNVVKGGGAAWGTHPWSHLLLHLFASMTGLSLAFAVGLLVCLSRARGLALVALAFFVLHSVVPHKEIRFILTVLPLFGACVGVALSSLPAPLGEKLLTPAVLLAALFSLARAHTLTFGELGAYDDRPQASAWDDFGPVNRMLLAAGAQSDLCGLRIDVAHLAWTGGSTYVHRDVPLYMGGRPSPESRHFNYVLTGAGSGYPVAAKEGNLELIRLPIAECAKDVGYSWRLP